MMSNFYFYFYCKTSHFNKFKGKMCILVLLYTFQTVRGTMCHYKKCSNINFFNILPVKSGHHNVAFPPFGSYITKE